MGRPGLLEFVVYALVLTGAAGWVYALPPFTRDAGEPVQTATIEPTSASSSDSVSSEQSSTPENVGNEDGEAGEEPTVKPAQAQTAAASGPDAQPDLDPDAQPELDPDAQPDEQPELDPQANLLVVTARSLNMRSEPDAGSALVGNYPRGALVEEMDVSGNWVLVRADDGTTGWMYTGYLGEPEN